MDLCHQAEHAHAPLTLDDVLGPRALVSLSREGDSPA